MKHIFLLALLCPFLSHCMPTNNSAPPFSVGDSFSSFTISNIINHNSSSLTVPASGNTVYILNFVSIGCQSCYKDYSRLSYLQKQFGSKVQIVLVTVEEAAKVQAFFKSHHLTSEIMLPVAVADTALTSWFPHHFLPHTVWLQNGIVKAVTDPQYINENNIEIMLLGRLPRWPVKKDGVDYDASKALLSFNNVNASVTNPFYSAFSSHIPGLNDAFTQVKDSAFMTTTIINLPMIQSYLKAYGLRSSFPVSYIQLNVADTSRYVYDSSNHYKLEWQHQNTFCYQSVLPASLSSLQLKQKIIVDLDFYFGITSSFQKKKAPCLSLSLLQNKAAKPLLNSGSMPAFISLSAIVYFLNHNWFGTPVFDETGSTQKRYIPFKASAFLSLQSLQSWLQEYGLQLAPIEKEVEVLTLTENQKQ